MTDRVRAIVLGLIVQLAVSAVLVPWYAASRAEFYSGAKLALAIGLLANVLVRLLMMRWAEGTTASRPQAPTSSDAGREEIAGFWYALIAGAFAVISTSIGAALVDSRLAEATAAALVCVLLHQIVFATIAFHVQQRAARTRSSRAGTLLAIGVMASFFAVAVPALFRPIDLTDVVFAIPVILIAVVGIVRRRLSLQERSR